MYHLSHQEIEGRVQTEIQLYILVEFIQIFYFTSDMHCVHIIGSGIYLPQVLLEYVSRSFQANPWQKVEYFLVFDIIYLSIYLFSTVLGYLLSAIKIPQISTFCFLLLHKRM